MNAQIREGGAEIPAVTQADHQRALSIDAWLIGPGSLDAAARAFARHRIAYTPTPSPEIANQPMGSLPADIAAHVLRIGRVEWGQTPAHDAEGHGKHVADSVRITAANFGQEGDQHMHGLWLEGTETVLCHTGTSPNAPQTTRALVGAWNRLVDLASALKPTTTDPFTTARNDIAGLPGHGVSADVQVAEQRVGEVREDDYPPDFWEITTEDERESLFATLHGLTCNPSIEEIPLAMMEVVAVLRTRRSTPKPADPTSVAGERMRCEMRVRIQNALLASLGNSYDCTRVWSAWSYGTMSEDDFVPTLERLDELIDEIVAALATNAPEEKPHAE